MYEAAAIDGATKARQIWHVAIPALRPVIYFVITITIIRSFQLFEQPFIMTNGGPGQSTRTAIFYIAETGLQNFQMGAAAAASWILTLALMLVSVVLFAAFRERGEGKAR